MTTNTIQTTIEASQAVADFRAELLARRAAEEQKKKEADKKAFQQITSSTYVNSMGSFGSIVFTDNGRGRMAHTVGFLEALESFNPEQAYLLAGDLVKYLTMLSEYGGMMDSPEARSGHDGTLLQFPRFRVILGDDGGLGSFAIGWYAAIPQTRWEEKAMELAENHAQARHGKPYSELKDEQRDSVWEEAKTEANSILKIREELEVCRGYYPTWDKEKKYFSREYVKYGFCFNGGLIFHHDRDDITKGHWSTHT